MTGPIDGYATDLDARITALEKEREALKTIALLYCQIAFRDGFRAGVLFVPDAWNAEAHEQSVAWVAERKERLEADLADLGDDETTHGETLNEVFGIKPEKEA
jgi:hypothetical protein